jgi:hypothetical protein
MWYVKNRWEKNSEAEKNSKDSLKERKSQLIRPGCDCDMVLGGKCMENFLKM